MLGKQWLTRYSRFETHGSLIDRSRDRQQKMSGMTTWHFDLVMEFPPLLPQFAFLPLGYTLSRYLCTVNRVVAGVAIGFTGFGFLCLRQEPGTDNLQINLKSESDVRCDTLPQSVRQTTHMFVVSSPMTREIPPTQLCGDPSQVRSKEKWRGCGCTSYETKCRLSEWDVPSVPRSGRKQNI